MGYRFKRELKYIGILLLISMVIFAIISKCNFVDTIDLDIDGYDLTIYPIYFVIFFFLILYAMRIFILPFQLLYRLLRKI